MQNTKNIAKVLVVAFASYLLWVGFSQPPRELSPLEKKVETELVQTETPSRYSDGSWSVSGLLVRPDIKSGDAFIVRGVVQIVAGLSSQPDSWYVSLADKRGDTNAITIWITPDEAPLFKEGQNMAVQIRVTSIESGPRFETF